MGKLERLIQDETGELYSCEGQDCEFCFPKGKIRSLVVQNPCLDIGKEIEDIAERLPSFVPKGANSYVVSDFNCDTQHIREDEPGHKQFFSVYAIQFYRSYY